MIIRNISMCKKNQIDKTEYQTLRSYLVMKNDRVCLKVKYSINVFHVHSNILICQSCACIWFSLLPLNWADLQAAFYVKYFITVPKLSQTFLGRKTMHYKISISMGWTKMTLNLWWRKKNKTKQGLTQIFIMYLHVSLLK